MSALTDTKALLPKARTLVIEHRRGSISLVQRHLQIGYNAAAELLEMLEREGVVGPIQPPGGRAVLVVRASDSAAASQSQNENESAVSPSALELLERARDALNLSSVSMKIAGSKFLKDIDPTRARLDDTLLSIAPVIAAIHAYLKDKT